MGTIGLPQIDAKINYTQWLKEQLILIPAEFFGGTPGEFAEVSFVTKHNMSATATLNQLIFDGSYLVGLQSAKTYLKISENAKEKTEIGIREAIINAYGNVLLNEESILILEKNIDNLEKTLFETNQIYLNGFGEEEDVEQLKITLASVKSQLSKAKKLKSIDYKIAKNTVRSNELLVKLEQSKALPTISSFVNFDYSGYSSNFDFFKKEQPWFDSSLLGIALDIPIFSSLARSSRTQQAKIELEKAKTEYNYSVEEFETSKQN